MGAAVPPHVILGSDIGFRGPVKSGGFAELIRLARGKPDNKIKLIKRQD